MIHGICLLTKSTWTELWRVSTFFLKARRYLLGRAVLPQPSQCREWWVGFLLIAMITVSLEPKWTRFAQVNIADIFMLSSKLPKQNENVSESREKSYGANTKTAPKQQKQQYFFLLCLGASLCNSGLLAGVK